MLRWTVVRGGADNTLTFTQVRRQSCTAGKKNLQSRSARERPAAEVSDAAAAALGGAPALTPHRGLERAAGQRHCRTRCAQSQASRPRGLNPRRFFATQVQLFQWGAVRTSAANHDRRDKSHAGS